MSNQAQYTLYANSILSEIQWVTLMILILSLMYLGFLKRDIFITKIIAGIIGFITGIVIGMLNILLFYDYLINESLATKSLGLLKLLLFESNPLVAFSFSILLAGAGGFFVYDNLTHSGIRIDVPANQNSFENSTDWKDLYRAKQFRNRSKLKNNECVILAHVLLHRSLTIAPSNPNEWPAQVNFTTKDSRNILKFKFTDENPTDASRWYRGFVSARRRLVGHMTFCSGTAIPMSIILFDKQSYNQNDKYEPNAITYPQFDNIPIKKSIDKIRKLIKFVNGTLKSTKNKYLIDKSVIFSGEAIRFFYTAPELSFFSAWRSIESIAKYEFTKEETRRGTSQSKISKLWRNMDKIGYIKKVLSANKIPFDESKLKFYYYLRNYIGHGSVNAIGTDDYMKTQEESHFADINSKTIEVIKLSRSLIWKYL